MSYHLILKKRYNSSPFSPFDSKIIRLVTREDATALRPSAWESYMSQRFGLADPERRASYEWDSIKAAVRDIDGYQPYVAMLSLSEHYSRSLT